MLYIKHLELDKVKHMLKINHLEFNSYDKKQIGAQNFLKKKLRCINRLPIRP